jgi:hypothetical protein
MQTPGQLSFIFSSRLFDYLNRIRPCRPRQEMPIPQNVTRHECRGTLWEIEEAGTLRFRHRAGHAVTADTMLQNQQLDLERALWAALGVLDPARIDPA